MLQGIKMEILSKVVNVRKPRLLGKKNFAFNINELGELNGDYKPITLCFIVELYQEVQFYF